jgi:hypothetical protein
LHVFDSGPPSRSLRKRASETRKRRTLRSISSRPSATSFFQTSSATTLGSLTTDWWRSRSSSGPTSTCSKTRR